jgi:hypothetical protein
MANEKIKQLSEALEAAGYEITSYSEVRDIYTKLKIKLEITPSHNNKNKIKKPKTFLSAFKDEIKTIA